MKEEKTLILTGKQVTQKIRRIAYEIYEHNFNEEGVVLAGIDGQGYTLAQNIAGELKVISPLQIKLTRVSVDKIKPETSQVTVDCTGQELTGKCVVLVDDVLNTGKTMAYALKPFLQTAIKKIEIAVLVNRSHTNFPIYPQYTGYELSTTINEHVEVVLGKSPAVYLH